MSRAHLPTGRIPIESIVEFLICQFSVQPTSANWQDIIRRNRESFEKNRTWVQRTKFDLEPISVHTDGIYAVSWRALRFTERTPFIPHLT